MKNIKILLALSCSVLAFGFPKSGFAQRVTFNDLKFVLYHSLEENEDYLLKKGFTYAGISDLDGGVSSYNYSKNSKHSREYYSIGKKNYEDFSYEVSFYTLSQNDYVQLKSLIKQQGFILKTTNRNKQTTIYDFEKGNLLLSFWVTLSEDGFPDYYISLVDKALAKKVFGNMRANENDTPKTNY